MMTKKGHNKGKSGKKGKKDMPLDVPIISMMEHKGKVKGMTKGKK